VCVFAVCVYVYVCVCVCVCVCSCEFMCVCLRVCVCVLCVCVLCVYVCVCMHAMNIAYMPCQSACSLRGVGESLERTHTHPQVHSLSHTHAKK